MEINGLDLLKGAALGVGAAAIKPEENKEALNSLAESIFTGAGTSAIKPEETVQDTKDTDAAYSKGLLFGGAIKGAESEEGNTFVDLLKAMFFGAASAPVKSE